MKSALIFYTTQYKEGGNLFKQVAHTLAQAKKREGMNVWCEPTESKAGIKALLNNLVLGGETLDELHFVGHAGMYGPMFGTVDYPEQFSPHEIRTLRIPFAKGAEAYFHCCRSARWFAPFFAQTRGVPAHGFHWYTAFSTDPHRYKMVWPKDRDGKIYCFGCPGKKSHGLFASLKKYTGRMQAEKLKKFIPEATEIDTSYDPVAELYHEVFTDIKVRIDEYGWIKKHLLKMTAVCSISDVATVHCCGN